MLKRGISSLELVFMEDCVMKQVNCPICNRKCIKHGKIKSGSQRWFCKSCKLMFTPKIEESKDVLYLDGMYLSRKSCILICCDKDYVLGWYLCRYEHSGAWEALMSRIAEPKVVVSDGGTGFRKALKRKWPKVKHQRCVFHVFSQVKRYTTSRPNTLAGLELYSLASDLFDVKSVEDSKIWINRFTDWIVKHKRFLSEVTYKKVFWFNEYYIDMFSKHNSRMKVYIEYFYRWFELM